MGAKLPSSDHFSEKHVAICTKSHVLQVNTHVTRCASLHCASQFRAVCLCLLAWVQGHGQAQADTGPQALPDQQRSCSCLSCVISCLVRAMAAAGWRKSGKSRAESSNQSWSPISEQVTEDESHSPALVLASEHQQQSSASDLTLPQQHQQTGFQTQPASTSLDQPQVGSGQYQPTGNDQTPTPTGLPVQYQLAGNDLTPPAGANANSGRHRRSSTDSPYQPRTMPRRDRTLLMFHQCTACLR